MMTRKQEEALAMFVMAVIGGAVLQAVAKREAGVLGLSAVELSLLSAGVGALAARRLS